MTRSLLALLPLLASTAMAGELLPLDVGDALVYQQEGPFGPARQFTVEVAQTSGPWWKRYTDFAGLGSTWIASQPTSPYHYVWDPTNSTQRLVRDGETAGTIVPVTLGSCVSSYEVLEDDAKITVPAGSFGDVLHVSFRGQCSDAGLVEGWLAPGVGLVQYTESSFGGLVTTQLSSGHVGDQTYPSRTGLEITGTANEHVVWVGGFADVVPSVHTTLAVTNHDLDPIEFVFYGGHAFDVIVRDVKGGEVLRWSDGKVFPRVVLSERIGAGESLSYAADTSLVDRNGATLAPGSYTVEMVLADGGETVGSRSPLIVQQVGPTR